jgi:spore maturation protein CgeB
MSRSSKFEGNEGAGFKILLVGDYTWLWYEEACAKALEEQGCKVERFGWLNKFKYWEKGNTEPVYRSIIHRIQYRLFFGPMVWEVERELYSSAVDFKPDIIWFYNVQLISASTVRKMRKSLPQTVFCQYSNDNPFSKDAKPLLWNNYLESIKYFHMHFAYRQSNILDYNRYGSKNVNLLRSYFIPEMDKPEDYSEVPTRFICDVVFAGHYEDDGRVQMLEDICRAGFKLNLFGGGWEEAFVKLGIDSPLRKYYPISPVTGQDYQYAICGAKVALCFLSTLNQDTYTRRNFQIPAMKVAMLSQYSDDLATLFIPDIEAMFFRNSQELIEKLSALVQDPVLRNSIGEAGFNRVNTDGHDVYSRMKTWLKQVTALK